MGPKEFDAYMQHVLDTQFTPAEKSLKKSIIKKINKVQKKRGRKIFKEEFVNERKNPKREKLKKDFKTSLKFVKGVIRKIDTFMKSDYWGMVDGFVTDKRTGLVSIVKDMEKSMNQIIKMPVDESVNEALPNRVWMDLRKKYSTNELKRFFKKESVNEDTKDIVKAKKLSRKIGNVEGRYRKAMYDLSDRLQADPKNHKLQDELIKSYTKHVTSFMKDMVKITKRVK